MYKMFLAVLILFFAVIITGCSSGGSGSGSGGGGGVRPVSIGDIITFGEYQWRVLDIKDGKALIITEGVIECRPYHETYMSVTWLDCDLREYLNGEFYNKFSNTDKARIIETNIINQNNQWYSTPGGITTNDKIFLLSLEEVVLYFGDSGDLANRPTEAWYIDDSYNASRIASTVQTLSWNGNVRWNAGEVCWWWLRSPGNYDIHAACVGSDGCIYVTGSNATNSYGCLRPALWLNL